MAAPNGIVSTIVGSISAVAVSLGAVYTTVIAPQNSRIEELRVGRADDQKRLVDLYVSDRTNEQYKKLVETVFVQFRRDLDRVESSLTRIDEEQKRRSSTITSVGSVENALTD